MRHGVFGRQLSRNTNERKRLLVNLAKEVIKRGTMKTSLAKAKAVQPLIEKLVSRAKTGKTGKRLLFKNLADKELVNKLLTDAETRFAKRSSGFTRIIKLGRRRGDATEEAVLMFVDEEVKAEVIRPKTEQKTEAAENKVSQQAKPAMKSKVKNEI